VSAKTGIALPDFARWGEIERQPMSNIRRTTATRLSHAWNTIPHVTQFDKADITAMEELRRKYREQVQKAGGNLTVTAMLVKVIATPSNSSRNSTRRSTRRPTRSSSRNT
jgi:pyruvate dehydrogenase E2 component (dihydrolipoamide acetyltransferase)